jgi:soluble lytic murein transglycosylase-like protein
MIETVILILMLVESGGDPNAVGDGGQAIGVLQIHPIMVEDVNRIYGAPVFSDNDRWDVEASKEMARIYLGHYCEGMTQEPMLRCWPGGPDGWQQDCTLPYLERCRAVDRNSLAFR